MFYPVDQNEWRRCLQMYKICPNRLIWASSQSQLLEYLRGVMESLYTKFAPYDSKNLCARTDTVFLLISEVCNGTVSLIWCTKTPPNWYLSKAPHDTCTEGSRVLQGNLSSGTLGQSGRDVIQTIMKKRWIPRSISFFGMTIYIREIGTITIRLYCDWSLIIQKYGSNSCQTVKCFAHEAMRLHMSN